MIHRLPFIFLSLFLFSTAIAQHVINPLSPQNRQQTNIDSAFIEITPFVNYAQVDLTLNFSAKATYFVNQGPELWLEVVTNFPIPDKTVVVDSWLWIEDYISEAYLIDLNTATEVYESYVTRTQDPSLLRYAPGLDNQLSLNIYPLPADSYRKVKLTFLVPINNETTAFSVDPIKDILIKENRNASSYCEVKVNNNDEFTSGSLRTALGNYSIKELTSDYTVFKMDLHAIDQAFAISYNKNTTDKHFSFYETTDFNYYALETFIPFDFDNCHFSVINKVLNDSSLTYNRYVNVEVYPSGFTYNESGNYINNPPENFVLDYICANQVFKDSLHISPLESPLTEKVWARDKIMDLTQNKSNAYSYYYNPIEEPNYVDILLTSMDYRVLSFYTAFLALPQEDTVEASLENNNFMDPSITVSVQESTTDAEPKISCFPNPFKEKLKIQVNLPKAANYADLAVRIIDITGKTIHNFESLEVDKGNELNLEWFANEENEPLSNGIYFVLVKLNDTKYTYEVLKQ